MQMCCSRWRTAMTDRPVKRPALRWHGGKWLLAPWIIDHFPNHRVYVEPFGGAASVLLRKPRAYAEVYNDLDQDVVNLFRVLRDPARGAELRQRLELTPFARSEFADAYVLSSDPVERARQLIVRSFMGFSSLGAVGGNTGFRSTSNRSGTTPAHDWANLPKNLPALIERLAGVVIENRPALAVMQQFDGPATLHYVDPPYVHGTRSRKIGKNSLYHVYRHEMGDADHVRLIETLRSLKGMVVLSGYPSDLYDAALHDWRRVERQALADGARLRTEVLWLNSAAIEASAQCNDQLELLGMGAKSA